jgi:protein-disulfide isomerase
LDDSEQNHFETKPENVLIKKSTFYGLILGIIVIIGVAGFFAGSYITNLNSDQVTQKELDDAISKLELKVLQKQLPSTPSIGPIRISVDDDPMKGNPNASITIIEFSDFQCPFCAKFHETTLPLLEKNYISTGKVNFVYRDFPIVSIHPNAVPAALASECADDQGKFWEIHDMIFENQRTWQGMKPSESTNLFKEYAVEIGLNLDEFNSCVDSGKYLKEIQNDLDDGRVYGVTGTPGFFVGNSEIGYTKLIGAQPFSSFKQVIDGQLSR